MSLYRRLHPDEPPAEQGPKPARDTHAALRTKIHAKLIDELGPLLFDRKISEEDLRHKVSETLKGVILRERAPLSVAERNEMVEAITDDVVGYGPIDRFLRDDQVTDIMVNGPGLVFVERGGVPEKTEVTFADESHLRRIIEKIVGQVGRRIDESSPLCDARLPDGSRVNAVVHPVALGGPFLTIRKFSAERLRIDDLIQLGTLTVPAARFVQACVLGRLNIVVSGGSSTGKTSALNVFSSFIPADERIITVEDARELQLAQDHVLALEARPPNVEGSGEITIRDLVRNTLRMRPDRIVVGECRGAEALDMLQAMNTGHDGSLTTVHSNSPRDALSRLETLVLMAGFDLPMRAIREQLSSALDLIVHMARLRDGSRRVTHVTEVQDMEGDDITLQDIFLFDYGMGFDETHRHRGKLKATGIVPKFAEKLADLGIGLAPDLFEPEEFVTKALASGPIGEEQGESEPADPPAAAGEYPN